MIRLLDANVLIALGDADHPHRAAALRFFENTATIEGWATCPLTENAFLRILSAPGHPRCPGSPEDVRRILRSITAAPGHQFWPDEISLLDSRMFPTLPGSKAQTDLYLLGLAVKRGARFATFDRNIDASLVPGGPAAYDPIPVS